MITKTSSHVDYCLIFTSDGFILHILSFFFSGSFFIFVLYHFSLNISNPKFKIEEEYMDMDLFHNNYGRELNLSIFRIKYYYFSIQQLKDGLKTFDPHTL